jgi:outer membrane protein
MSRILIVIVVLTAVSGLIAEQSISLEEAKEIIIRNNPEFLAKESALKAAEWEMRAALSAMFPSLNLQAGYNYLDPKPYATAAENYTLSYGLNASQPIFLGGKLWLSYRMKSDALQIAKADLNNTRLNLLSQLEEAYYNCLLTTELYEINLRALDIASQNLDIAGTRMETGTLSRADYLQLQAELSTREVNLLQAEKNRQLSYRRLQNMLKIDDFEVQPVDFSLYERLIDFYQNIEHSEQEFLRERLIEYGIENNPMLVISRTRKSISNKSRKISFGNFLPTINLSASRNWNNNYSGERDFDSTTTYMLSASLPIFPIFDNYSTYRSSHHSYQQTERETESAEDSIKLSIEAAFYSGISSARTITSAELAYDYAEETYRMMEERFQNGLISSLDLISVELLLTSSSLSATTSKYEFLKNRSVLMHLLNMDDDELFWMIIINK